MYLRHAASPGLAIVSGFSVTRATFIHCRTVFSHRSAFTAIVSISNAPSIILLSSSLHQ